MMQAINRGNEVTGIELSIVLVNSDGTEDTLNCLASIYQHPLSGSFEVILVDNRSRASCLPSVHERYPQVITLTAPKRQGFAKNYNLGMHLARGKNILILNNDTLIHRGSLDALVNGLQGDANYGMVGPRLVSDTGRIQSVCARPLITSVRFIFNQLLLDPGLPTGKLREAYVRRRLEKRLTGPVACINGACMLVSRQTVEAVGPLDEDYEFYFEDVEWCHRMKNRGYLIGYISEATVTHFGDRSLSKVREWAKQSEYLGALRYFRQYHQVSWTLQWAIWLATLISFQVRALAFFVIEMGSKEKSQTQAYQNLIGWIISRSPAKVTDSGRTAISNSF